MCDLRDLVPAFLCAVAHDTCARSGGGRTLCDQRSSRTEIHTAPHLFPTSWTHHHVTTRELVATSPSLLPPPLLWHLGRRAQALRFRGLKSRWRGLLAPDADRTSARSRSDSLDEQPPSGWHRATGTVFPQRCAQHRRTSRGPTRRFRKPEDRLEILGALM